MIHEKVKLFFAGVGAAVILIAGTVVGIITGRNRQAPSLGQSDLDKNNNDIRQQLDKDRERAAEAKRIMAESERLTSGMADIIESGKQSTDRTGSIIDDTRNTVSEIISATKSKD